MSSLIKPALIIVLKRLPIVLSVIEDNQLTTPVALDETVTSVDGEPTVQMITGAVDLYGLMQEQYPQELSLFTAIQGHCTKTIYLLTEGELRIFLTEKEAVAIKRISDTLRDAGVSIIVREKLMDLLMDEDNDYEWISVDDEADIPLLDPATLSVHIPDSWSPKGTDYGLANLNTSTPTSPAISQSSLATLAAINESGVQLFPAEQTVVNKITATGTSSLVGVEMLVLNNLMARINATSTPIASTTTSPWTPAGASFGQVPPPTPSTPVATTTSPWTPAGASFGQVHTPISTTPEVSSSSDGYTNLQMIAILDSNPTFPLTHSEMLSVNRLKSNPSRAWSQGEYLFLVGIVNRILGAKND